MNNREILFRAIAIHGNEWVFGNYIHSKRMSGRSCEHRIVDKDTGMESDIIPETLGQFTGLLDKNGKKIFEGDKIIYNFGFDDDSQPKVSTVKRGDITSDWETCSGLIFENHHYSDAITEVIGTIHDHLLKGE